jgi:pyruvate formate lyase activating enzyme
LLQWEFVAELFQRLHCVGIHTALDTAGIGDLDGARTVLLHTDLVLCDLKFSRDAEYLRYCKGNMDAVLAFLKLTQDLHVPLWIRHVVVPGLTDRESDILKIASQASQFSNLQKLELLPFHKMCMAKYDALSIPFPLRDYEECPNSTIQERYKLIKDTAIRNKSSM